MKNSLKNKFAVLGVFPLLSLGLVLPSFNDIQEILTPLTVQTGVVDQLNGKSAKEKAQIKAHEIAKLASVSKTHNGRYKVAVQVISVTEIPGGVEVFIKAWDKNGRQYGFGPDGKVEIERVRIINPPILIPDGTKSTRKKIDELTGEVLATYQADNFKEDIKGALLESLAHTVTLIGKDGSNIVKGKVGNTTTTIYPDADPETNTTDGPTWHSYNPSGSLWSTLIAASGTGGRANNGDDTMVEIRSQMTAYQWIDLWRSIFLFDTASIPDGDIIFSATISIYGSAKADPAYWEPNVNIYSSNPATTTDVAAGDYDSFGGTAFSTAISYTNFSTAAYNDFSLNASGTAAISKTGISKFGVRNANYDVAGVDPTWSASKLFYINVYYAENAGTTSDPKIVIAHSAASGYTTVVSDIDYAPTGKISYIRYGSNASTTYTYDAAKLYRLTNIRTTRQ